MQHDDGHLPVPDDVARARSLVVRLWLPDRPGALGQVASRIGAVRGDLLAIDILERGGGQVVDELVVSLPNEVGETLLAREIGAVDGVAVEYIRQVPAERPDPAMAMFALAASVAEADPADAVGVFCSGLRDALDADWAVVTAGSRELYRTGEPPAASWLSAFLHGSDHLDAASGPQDVIWARLPVSGLAAAAGRSTRAAHERERARLRVLARIVDRLLVATQSHVDAT
jgi:hypothetical protein